MEREKALTPDVFNGPQLKPGIPTITLQEEALKEDLPNEPLWIDYDSAEESEDGIKSAGPETYVISPITQENIFSDKYINCLGTIGIGREKGTGIEIAFLSHQDPNFFLNKGPEATKRFETDLKATLSDLITRSEEGTVEVVLLGGNDIPADPTAKKSTDYSKSIELLKTLVKEVLGSSPTVLLGPNHDAGAIDVTVLTAERKIVVGR